MYSVPCAVVISVPIRRLFRSIADLGKCVPGIFESDFHFSSKPHPSRRRLNCTSKCQSNVPSESHNVDNEGMYSVGCRYEERLLNVPLPAAPVILKEKHKKQWEIQKTLTALRFRLLLLYVVSFFSFCSLKYMQQAQLSTPLQQSISFKGEMQILFLHITCTSYIMSDVSFLFLGQQ